MSKQRIHVHAKKTIIKYSILFFVLSFSLLALSSCCTPPPKAETIESGTQKLGNKINEFWTNMENTASEDREFQNFKDEYNSLQGEIEAAQKLNKKYNCPELNDQWTNVLGEWILNKKSHEADGTPSDTFVEQRKQNYARFFESFEQTYKGIRR